MSVKTLAQKLQAEGRRGDSLLVHMTPREVGGLQALAKAHGGSLTVNPKTGLVEANFLEAILPTILGLGITAATGGAAAPWMVGAGIGAGTAAITGDLEKGLLAGLGAFGGAGLGGSLMAAGQPAASAAAAMGVEGAATGAGSQAAMLADQAAGFGAAGIENIASSASYAPGVVPTTPSAFQQMGAGLQAASQSPGSFLSNNLTNIGMAAAPMLGAFEQEPQEVPDEGDIRQYSYTQEVNPNFGMVGQPYFNQYYTPGPVTPANQFTGFAEGGIAEIQGPYKRQIRTVDPAVTEYNQNLMQRAQAEYNQAPQLAAFQSALPNQGAYNPQAGAAFQALQQQRQQQAQDMQANQFGYKYDPLTNSVVKAQPSVDQFAELQKQMEELRSQSKTGMEPYYGNEAANGGIMRLNKGGYTLGDYSDGGRLLKGPGDGVSDDIPATIEGRQPARLADGEFVIPARIVSEIGNGSTDAGAKHLYAMMDKIQKNRAKTIGKDKIAVNTRSYKELPA